MPRERSKIKRHRNQKIWEKPLTDIQKEMLHGTMMGDGFLQVCSRTKPIARPQMNATRSQSNIILPGYLPLSIQCTGKSTSHFQLLSNPRMSMFNPTLSNVTDQDMSACERSNLGSPQD